MLMKLNIFLLAMRMMARSKILDVVTPRIILDDDDDDNFIISINFISVNYSSSLFHSILRA